MTKQGRREVTMIAMFMIAGVIWSALIERQSWQSRLEIHAVDSLQHPRLVIDVNTSQWQVLTLVDGVGPVLAERIADAREERAFTSTEDLQSRVAGVGSVMATRLWTGDASGD